MPTNEKAYVVDVFICRHDISCIYYITFLLLADKSQAHYITLYACKNMYKGITTVDKVVKHVQRVSKSRIYLIITC